MQLGQVHAGAEHRAGRRQDHAPGCGVVLGALEGVGDGGDQRAAEGVALVGAVEGDDHSVRLVMDSDQGFGHGGPRMRMPGSDNLTKQQVVPCYFFLPSLTGNHRNEEWVE